MSDFNSTPEDNKRTGKPKPIPELDDLDIERFFSKIDRTPGQGPEGRCHRWIGTFNKAPMPYGVFKAKRKMIYAHRLAFILEYGSDPAPLIVCHRCDRTWCVNPECFFISDTEGNAFDAMKKRRRATGLRNGQHTHPERRAKGETCARSKLNGEKALRVVMLHDAGWTNQEIAKEMGVVVGTVWHILEGRTWNHITGIKRHD